MAVRKFLIFLIILLFVGCGEDLEDFMAQSILDRPINPNTKSGTVLADDLSALGKFQDTILSNHAGNVRPSYADGTNGGMIWIDFSGFPTAVHEKLWTGAVDVILRTIDFMGPVIIDQVSPWVAGRDYPIGEYVLASDYNLYRGRVTPNTGNNPVSSPTQWKQQTGLIDTSVDTLVADSGDANCTVNLDGADAGCDMINVGSVEDQNGSLELKTDVYEIGDWNMDTTVQVSVSIAAAVDASKTVSLVIVIKHDDGDAVYPLDYSTAANAVGGSYYYDSNSGNVILTRYTGGFFDATFFNSTSYNRGWVYITYYE